MKSFPYVMRLWIVLFAFLTVSSTVHAQEFSGRVTDSSGAVIPNAKITVHNQGTGINVTTITTGTGDYTVPYLKTGSYTLTASAQGFETMVKTDVTLHVEQTAVINFALKVGSVATTVTVKTDQELLDFSSADHGEVVENTRVTEIPLNGRDPNLMALLDAGVTWNSTYYQYQRPFDDTMTNLSINGGGGGNNELLLDGVSNEAAPSNSGSNSKISYVPPVEAVQEFKIVTNTYDAQFGRAAGGALNEVLKSGTNRLHGNAYEFARRTWLDANTWQNDWYLSRGGTGSAYRTPQMKWDQYGVELDGPVILPKLYNGKDKTFFLLQFENFKEIQPGTTFASVPDPNWVNGDFSNLTWYNGANQDYETIWLYDPLSLNCSGSTCTRQTFAAEAGHPGDPNYNKIPSSRMNAVAQKIMAYYPKPNTTPAAATNPFGNNYVTPTPQLERYRNALAKLDHNLTASDRFSIHYGYWERVETGNTNAMPGVIARGNLPHGERSHNFVAEWTHTFRANLLFDFRGTANVRTDYTNSGPAGFDETSLGWPSSMVNQFGYTRTVFPYIQPSEFAYIGSNAPSQTVDNTAALFPSLTWIHGKHSVHVGTDARFLQYAVTLNGGGPYFWVDRQWTQSNYVGSQWTNDSGNSFASMLLGTMTSGNFSINSQALWSTHYWAPFVQDDWKITSRLTLNLGIRWDFNEPQTERHNRADYAFDTTDVNPVDSQINHTLMPNGEAVKGGMTFLGVNGAPRTLYSLVKTNIQPRFGFSYAVSDRTVLRGGFGEMFSNPTPGGNLTGFSATTQYIASNDGGKTPTQNLSQPFTSFVQQTGASLGMLTSLGQGPFFLNPNFKIPSYWSYSMGIQQQLSKHDTMEISYVGSRSYNNNSSDNINRETAAYQQPCNPDLGGNPSICNNDYPTNPFYQISAFNGSGYYTAKTIQGGNFTRPFPAFTDMTEWQLNDGRTWYNSLQVTAMHKWDGRLTLHGTWTWSKLMDAGGWQDTTYRIPTRAIDGNDRPQRVTVSGVYLLPVGKGQKLLSNPDTLTMRVLDGVVGGWELGSAYIFELGWPWAVPNNPVEHYVHNAWVSRHVDKSTGYIRGVAACASKWVQASNGTWSIQPLSFNYTDSCPQTDFVAQPQYGATYNTVYTGIRVPNNQQFDSNLSKNFAIREGVKLQLRLEAFNTLNHPLWQINYTGSTQDTNFGTIERGPTGQSNQPRTLQLAAKVSW